MSDIATPLEAFPPRIVGGAPQPQSLADEDREALRRLCAAGCMNRLAEGGYGTAGKRLLTNAVAIRLKKRQLAVPGFNREIYPSLKGKQIMAEDADARAAQ